MKIKKSNLKEIEKDEKIALVLPFFSGEKQKIKDVPEDAFSSLDEGETRIYFLKNKIFLLFNVGKKDKWNERKLVLNIKKIVRLLKSNKISKAAVLLDDIIFEKRDEKKLVKKVTENALIANYDFENFKKEKSKGKIEEIYLVLNNSSLFNDAINEGTIIANAVNFARDLSNIPGGEMTPKKLASLALEETKKIKSIKFKVIGKKKLEEMKMGGILAVSQGSSEEPQLIIMEHLGRKNSKKTDILFVGKGLTFDSGGLNIKIGDSMSSMHMDMSGGASTIAALKAAAELKIPLNISAIIPAVENMTSGQSFRPGDILKSYSGKTIEVENTDAEGRIILADALWFGVSEFKPKLTIDVATLTGAAMVALGYRATALFTNKDSLESLLRRIGEDSGDYVWPFPCWDDYQQEIKGNFGDISNTGVYKRVGGAITGAMFLKSFVKETPWVHLDIAPTMTSVEGQGLAKGATGVGVRYLLETLNQFKEIEKLL